MVAMLAPAALAGMVTYVVSKPLYQTLDVEAS
jgi:hypothetical protein